MLEPGYYYILYKGKLNVGVYQPHTDIHTQRPFPWSIIGERIGFETWELTVLQRIEPCAKHST